MNLYRFIAIIIVSLSVFIFAPDLLQNLDARPGGGHSSRSYSSGSSRSYSSGSSRSYSSGSSSSYSSGSSSSYSSGTVSGGGGSVDDDLDDVLSYAQLIISAVIIIVALIWGKFFDIWGKFFDKRGSDGDTDYDSGDAASSRIEMIAELQEKDPASSRIEMIAELQEKDPASSRIEMIAELQEKDPAFSRILFLDFVQLIYNQYQEWRSKPQFENLSPVITASLLDKIQKTHTEMIDVTEVVINSMLIESIIISNQYDKIYVTIDSNYTETSGKKSKRFMMLEQWQFRRPIGVTSLAPDRMREYNCPACGAGMQTDEFNRCKFCGTDVGSGNYQWELAEIDVLKHESMSATQFGVYEAEVGTNLPTVTSPYIEEEKHAFMEANSISEWFPYYGEFCDKIVVPIFNTVYDSYTRGVWKSVRAVVSDNIFKSISYWIHEYKNNGYVNVLKDYKISNIAVSRIESDEYYDTMTVRIFASVIDYVTGSNGKVIGGDIKKPRCFTEYWTFVRRAGVQKKEKDFSPDQCPNCAAPISVNQTGVCQHCNTTITSGEFGWILSVITQDEAYEI